MVPNGLYSICERHPYSANLATWRTEAAYSSKSCPHVTRHLEEGGRANGGEDLLGLRGVAVRQRELEVLGQKLLDVGAADVLGLLNLNDLEDVDRPEAGTVTGGHVLVEGLDGVGAGHLTVLTVHVVSAGAGVVADPDANVLDLEGVLLVDLRLSVALSGMDKQRTWNIFTALRWCVLTSLRLTISPLAFLIFLRRERKYQKRLLATTVLGAKMRIR